MKRREKSHQLELWSDSKACCSCINKGHALVLFNILCPSPAQNLEPQNSPYPFALFANGTMLEWTGPSVRLLPGHAQVLTLHDTSFLQSLELGTEHCCKESQNQRRHHSLRDKKSAFRPSSAVSCAVHAISRSCASELALKAAT